MAFKEKHYHREPGDEEEIRLLRIAAAEDFVYCWIMIGDTRFMAVRDRKTNKVYKNDDGTQTYIEHTRYKFLSDIKNEDDLEY